MDLSCADIVRYNEKLFILTRDTQCLFEYYPLTRKINFCGTVRSKLGQFFIGMTIYEDKLYIAPYEADVFCIYDIKTREFQRISLKRTGSCDKRKRYKICFSYQRKIYFLGGRGTVMLRIDTDTNDVEEITEWDKIFYKKFGYETWVRSHQGVCIADCCFWVALEGNNILLQYNMVTNEYYFWNVGTKKMQYVTVSFDGKYFWLSGEEKAIVRWKRETNEVKEFEEFPEGFETGSKEMGIKELFSCGYIWNGNIYFAPLNSNMLVKFDRVSNQMKCVIKTDMNHICFKIAEMGDQKLYMEANNIKDQRFSHAYFIDASDKYRRTSICIEKLETLCDDFLIKKIKMEDNTILELFPQCIVELCKVLEKEKISDNNTFQNSIGEIIWNLL